MGCSQSFTKQSSEKHVPSDTLTESSSYKGTSTTSVDKNKNNNNKKPTRPMVFAIMRNGHEVIRGGMKDIQTALDEHRVEEAMDIYLQLDKWMKLHFLMEEGRPGSAGDTTPMGMFRLLDHKFDNVATKAGLRQDHEAVDEVEAEAMRAVQARDGEAFSMAFVEYQQINIDHMEKEEKAMMPKVKEMIKEGASMRQLVRDELMALIVDSPDMEHFVKYANEILVRHADNMPRARVFDHALLAVSTPQEWDKYDAWIKETMPDEVYQEINNAIHA